MHDDASPPSLDFLIPPSSSHLLDSAAAPTAVTSICEPKGNAETESRSKTNVLLPLFTLLHPSLTQRVWWGSCMREGGVRGSDEDGGWDEEDRRKEAEMESHSRCRSGSRQPVRRFERCIPSLSSRFHSLFSTQRSSRLLRTSEGSVVEESHRSNTENT